MSDFQAIADRVEIEALRGEFTDAAMMRDRARLASLFTPRRRAADAQHPRRTGRPGTDPRRRRAAAGPVGVLRADHAPGHDPAGRRHRDRPCLHPGARPHPRRPPGAELRHLPRPLPAHRRRLEVHRAGLRGQVPRHHARWRARRPARADTRRHRHAHHDQPRRHHDYLDSGNTVRRPGARAAPGAGGRCADGTRFHRRNPRRRRRRAYPHQRSDTRGRQRVHRGQRDPPPVRHR